MAATAESGGGRRRSRFHARRSRARVGVKEPREGGGSQGAWRQEAFLVIRLEYIACPGAISDAHMT
eukprot:1942380-Pleurochrysis_carterae.AAC.1